jgi:NitT/TauT family transport system ATP-binding protein
MSEPGAGEPDAALISVRGLSKSFSGPDGRPVTVLDGITLDVGVGEFVALLGRSGSGKSTLLRCIAGLIAPSEGEVRFRGKRLTGTNTETTMVFQTFALLPWLTVQQNVELGLEARGVGQAERAERALRAIDLVGLDGYESAYPKELSGGMRQRVGFARALVVEPAALLMDEPFSALDVLTSENLRGELLELWEGQRFPTKTMIMVTHNIEEAVLLADRILVLGTNPGRIRSDMRNPLPRPRRRRTPDFEELVDQIYRMMTHRDGAPTTTRSRGASAGTPGDTPLPQATVDGLSGLAEVMLGRHDGVADLPDLSDNLGLDGDDLLPLVDALELLGFAELNGEHLSLTPGGRIFAGASIQDSKEIFARAALDRAPLVRTIYRALRGSLDGSLPAGFFLDLLQRHFGEDDADRQLDVAVNWGRYAELYAYDATRGQIIREEQGIGATLADRPEQAPRGELHLYLGAAPGSGKTFTMLRDGRAVRVRGEDVVIGYAQARGRPRTEAAMRGLEVIAPRRVPGDPAGDEEMDLDAVLARKPMLALVDDFARNATDIEVLREAGIDVFSTVDVTDLARAADVVRDVTGRGALEVVPDEALAQADEIRFVDNSPEALRKRLGHGNIYPADQADRALSGLFQASTLARLREIGLRVVAETMTKRDAVREYLPQNVLVAVASALGAGGGAEALVQRGMRLARRHGATCTVLALGPQARTAAGRASSALIPSARPGAVDAAIKSAAGEAGATFVEGAAGDPVTAIGRALRDSAARHLVVAEPVTGLLDRRRPSLAERLADQFPEIHLHIVASRAGQAGGLDGEQDDGDDGDGTDGPASGRPRGTVRIYLGYAAGCGITTAMLEEAGRRRSRGSDVLVATVDTHQREGVTEALEGLTLLGDAGPATGGSATDGAAAGVSVTGMPVTGALVPGASVTGGSVNSAEVLARRPEVVCIDDLTSADPGGESRFTAARQFAEAGINVVATVRLAGDVAGASTGDGVAAVGVGEAPDEAAVLALADEIEVVDVAPSVLANRVRRGEVVPPTEIEEALRTDYAPQTLAARRERAFALVVEHADRRLAGLQSGRDRASSDPVPRILACVAPRPGQEPLIRHAAAMAAQMAGHLLVAVVVPSPSPSPDGLDQLLAGYAALAAQLGGEFSRLDGPPAGALARFARQYQVTEMVLARDQGTQPTRYRVLRDLARGTTAAELYVLPA